jgi:dimethylglycine dehydrogenase
MVGVDLPVHAMEHQYLVTDDIPAVFENHGELPHVLDPKGESYLRQEGRGLVIGTYEQACEPWAIDGTSWDFGSELLADKLDRISDSLEMAYHRYPCLAETGLKRVINGPFTFSPDGNPLVGPVPGLRGYWSACAVMAGFSQGGGVGLSLAEWMINGEPSCNIFGMDVARFGTYCTKPYTRTMVVQYYQKRFSVPFPNEELPAGRPLRTTPAYGLWKEQNAVFGHAFGMEHVNYFAPEGQQPFETPTFRRSNAFPIIGEECRVVREAVGINEVHNFGKFEVSGPGAMEWLDTIMAGRIPKLGRISLTPMLSPSGKLIGDFTMARLGDQRMQLTASYGAQAYHMRWFQEHLPENGVQISNISDQRIGFQIAGPKSRELLSRVTRADVSNEALPFLQVCEIDIGLVPAIVCRVSYTGGMGYEIYAEPIHQVALYHSLVEAGVDLGLRPFGMRAMMSLRLEKSFGSWMREYKPDYTAAETGLDRFINFNKPDFIGRQTALAEHDSPPARQLVTLIVDADDVDVAGDEPVWRGNDVVGFVTSGGYAHYSQKSVALGFVPRELAKQGEAFHIEILGDKRPATVETQVLFDPQGLQLRG